MSLFYSLNLTIARRFGFKSKSHKFATFVAIISIVGIAIGVAALIIDTSIMQGLQNSLKNKTLTNVAHVTVKTDKSNAEKLLHLDNVIAVCPYIEDQVLVQTDKTVGLALLEGIDTEKLMLRDGHSLEELKLPFIPPKGSYNLNGAAAIFYNLDMRLNSRVKLISTTNARYTPMGLTPRARLFKFTDYFASTHSNAICPVIGNYEDVRKLFYLKGEPSSFRLFLHDPFMLDKLNDKLDSMGIEHSDFTATQGDFFKALAMEKISMIIMLCLIIVVAAFNMLSALAMTVSSRLTDIAILKSLGMQNKQILSIFLTVGLLSGLTGTLAGTAIGIPLTAVISNVMSMNTAMSEIPVSIEISNLLLIGFGSMLMSFLFTLYPALKAASSNPVENLTRG